MTGSMRPLSTQRLAHRRATDQTAQAVWIAFGGVADQPWLHLLRPGFRHCFAAVADDAGWTVLEPLSGRLLVVVVAQSNLPHCRCCLTLLNAQSRTIQLAANEPI